MPSNHSARPIFVPLAKGPYNKFASGRKTVEVRNAKSPVARQLVRDATVGRLVILSCGYTRHGRIVGRLGRVFWSSNGIHHVPASLVDGAALGDQPSQFYDEDGEIVAFEVTDIDYAIVPDDKWREANGI